MTTATRPTWLQVEASQIPERLRAVPRWVVWRGTYLDGKWTKEPYRAEAPAEHAATNKPSTWATFDAALATYTREADLDGVGYVLDWDDPIVGVDLDHCCDRDTGVIEPWAQAIVERLATYTERSPSGTGLRLFAIGALPEGRRVCNKVGPRQDGKIELYNDGRYLTITGHHVVGTPTQLENRLAVLGIWHAELFPLELATNGQPLRIPSVPPTEDDVALLDQARRAANGSKFCALYDHGDTTGYASGSEADLALCVLLAFWTQKDTGRIDRLFRASALIRDKWDMARGAQTYGARTLAAIAKCVETYDPLHGASRHGERAPALALGEDHATGIGLQPEEPLGLRLEDLTERGVADAMVRHCGHDLLYVETLGRWFIWTGTHFQEDDDRTIRHLLGGLVMGLARESLATRDPKLVTLALRCLQSRHIQGADQLSRDARTVSRRIEQLDDPRRTAHLLPTPTGTFDLRTGVVRPHDRADHFTRIATVSPATMPTPIWDACLARWTCDRPRLIAYLQRLVGYCMTGEIREHVLVLLLGDGGNGKTTFIQVFMDILGVYATVLPMDTLKAQKYAQHPTELMDLRGARLAVAIETESDQRLDEAKIKMLTGGEPVRARHVKKDFVTFPPTHKLVIYGNHPPKLRHVDESIRRRLHLLRFDAVIPDAEKDRRLDQKLRAEYPGIFQWAIDGAGAYYRDGLQPPSEVLTARRPIWPTRTLSLDGFRSAVCSTGPAGSPRPWPGRTGQRGPSGSGNPPGRSGPSSRPWGSATPTSMSTTGTANGAGSASDSATRTTSTHEAECGQCGSSC